MEIKSQNKITALYMGETDIQTGLWFPIRKMTIDYIDGEYVNCVTAYTQGAQQLQAMYPDKPNLVSFGSLDKVHFDSSINRCPFVNRMPLSRSPLPKKLLSMGFAPHLPVDPVEYTARSGGYRHGDNNDLFPEILPDSDGNYNFYFFPHSSYTFASQNYENIPDVSTGDELEVIPITKLAPHEKQLTNFSSVELRAKNRVIGSAPHYIQQLIAEYPDELKLSIQLINSSAPFEYKFLCQATLNSLKGKPFTKSSYQVINSETYLQAIPQFSN